MRKIAASEMPLAKELVSERHRRPDLQLAALSMLPVDEIPKV